MLLYLPGPKGPEQCATKWLLMQRGYRVVTAGDVASPRYAPNQGMVPSEADFMRRQAYEMMRADAVVLEEEVMEHTPTVLELLKACQWMGVAVLRYDELPAEAPTLAMRDIIIDERNLLRQERTTMSEMMVVRITWSERFAALRHMLQRWADAFDRRWGWALTNGNKQPAVRPYKLETNKPLTTA